MAGWAEEGPREPALACGDPTRSTLPLKGAGTLGRQRGEPVGQGGREGPAEGSASLGPRLRAPCGSLGCPGGKLPDGRLPGASHLPSRQDRGVSASQPLPLVPGTFQRDTLAPNANCFTATVILSQAVPEKGDFTPSAQERRSFGDSRERPWSQALADGP